MGLGDARKFPLVNVSFDVLLASASFSHTFTLVSPSISFLPHLQSSNCEPQPLLLAFSLTSLMDADTEDSRVTHQGEGYATPLPHSKQLRNEY